MSSHLLLKFVVIAVLTLLLMVPIALIYSVLGDRVAQRDAAKQNVMESTSGPQRLSGVALVLPYTRRTVVKETVATQVRVAVPGVPVGGKPAASRKSKNSPHKRTLNDPASTFVIRNVMKEVSKVVLSRDQVVFLPDTLAITGDVNATTLWRGIYGVPVFAASLQITSTFTVDVGALRDDASVTFGTPYLAVGVSDVRGLRTTPKVQWRATKVNVQPGAQLAALGEGVNVPLLGLDPKELGHERFVLPLQLSGATTLSFTPMGRSARINLRADWPHPSFYGRFLPTQRAVNDAGFTATWQTTSLATTLGKRFSQVLAAGGALPPSQDVGVAFVEPVDNYSQTERATKYALLFILLTFGAFFLFEIVRHLRIHPMQYALVGCALATFYLLLVALSEHMTFVWAYGVATAACVGLIGFYLAHVLQRWRRGFGFSAALTALYGALYGILRSEDHALLLGALLGLGAPKLSDDCAPKKMKKSLGQMRGELVRIWFSPASRWRLGCRESVA